MPRLNNVRWLNSLLRATSDRLTEASLFTRQGPEQLPELGESQLPVVVLVQRAHQLLHGPGITGVLWGDHREGQTPPFNTHFQPLAKSVLPPKGSV